jgi:hypothetical protein
MKFFSENHSGDVNIDSGPGFFHPFQPGIHIHIASESVFTSLRNDYSHAPESALINTDGKIFYRLPLSGGQKPAIVLQTEFENNDPHVSPDARWVAYQSVDSGRWELYLAAFPSFKQRRQVSNSGGGEPHWRKDGKELFYLSLDGKMMSVEVKAGFSMETGVPRALFRTPLRVQPLLERVGRDRRWQKVPLWRGGG